jgi:hypothetical protein
VTAERARWITLSIYLAALAISIVLLFIKQFNESDWQLVKNVENVLGLYAVPLSIIVTAVSSRRAVDASITGTTLTLLFGSTILWNGLVLGALAYLDWSSINANLTGNHFTGAQATDFLATAPGKLTFIVSGALTYFFVGDTAKPENPGSQTAP